MTLTLRPYQLAAVQAIRDRYAAGDRSTLAVLATGLGKAVIAAEVARRVVARGRRVLFLAHLGELLEHLADKLARAGVDAAIERADQRAGHADVVVASVQSLKGKRLAAFPRDAFGLIVVDEAHRSMAAGHRTVLGTFDAHVLGLTATPERLDGQALGDVYDSVAFRYELREGICDGWLAPLRAQRVSLESVDLSGVRTLRSGELDEAALEELLLAEKALHGVAVPLLRESGTRRTIAFCAGVQHAQQLAETLNRYEPGVARCVHGDMPSKLRAATLADFAAARFRILTNATLLVEGFDDPGISAVALVSPTASRGRNAQRIGRGTRLHPGKTDLLVLDFAGQVGRHRLAGPEDVLAGSMVTDEQRALLDAWMRAGGLDLEGALVRAARDAEEQARAEAASAEARYRVEELDPWLTLREAGPDDGSPASAKQLAALTDAGVKPRDGLTSAQAIAILEAVAERKAAGRCSVKLAKMLAARNVPRAAELSRAEGNALFQALRSTGYSYIPRRVLHAIRPELAAAPAAQETAA